MADETRHNRQASPAQIAEALKGTDFPKRKQELVEKARASAEAKENPDIVAVLERIPDREYGSMADLERGVSEAA